MQTQTSTPAPLAKGDLVLVTGVTGFIGVHVADQLLKAGYSVRGTARSGSRDKESVLNLFASYGKQFEIVETGDLTSEGVFDVAVKDVDAIAHVASPVNFRSTNPFTDLIDPAVQGTLSLISAAHKHGNKVRQIVVTSSIAAVLHPVPTTSSSSGPYEFTEKDWNDEAFQSVKDWKEGEPFDNLAAYRASKNEAERSVWRFVAEHTPRFAVSTILPVYVFGPIIHRHVSKADDINASSMYVWRILLGENKQFDPSAQGSIFVDVRDVALAHVRALEKGGIVAGVADVTEGRYILFGETFSDQQIADILREAFPERRDIIHEGTPGVYPAFPLKINTEKAQRELGIRYTSLKDSLVDTAKSYAGAL